MHLRKSVYMCVYVWVWVCFWEIASSLEMIRILSISCHILIFYCHPSLEEVNLWHAIWLWLFSAIFVRMAHSLHASEHTCTGSYTLFNMSDLVFYWVLLYLCWMCDSMGVIDWRIRIECEQVVWSKQRSPNQTKQRCRYAYRTEFL